MRTIRRGGFTMIEVVVMLSVITALSVVVLFSFTGLNEGVALNRSSRELALAIRKTQNMSLAIRRVQTPAGPVIPSAVGIQLSTLNAKKFLIFADLARDNRYNPADDVMIEEGTFERTIFIRSLLNQAGTPQTIVNIVFQAPEATVVIADRDGSSIGDMLTIELTPTLGGSSKQISVRTSGQVSIK